MARRRRSYVRDRIGRFAETGKSGARRVRSAANSRRGRKIRAAIQTESGVSIALAGVSLGGPALILGGGAIAARGIQNYRRANRPRKSSGRKVKGRR